MTRVAFVTGASRGIGKRTALLLAERGYHVAVTARTVSEGEKYDYSNTGAKEEIRAMPGSLESTVAEIHEQGGQAEAIRMDLMDRASIAASVKEAERRCGPIDLLVNNAIYQGPGTMDQVLSLDVENLERQYLGNAVNQLYLIQQVLPSMLERRSGVVVNVVSESGMIDPQAPAGEGGWGFGYSSSKAAFIRLVGILAVEHVGSGVRFTNMEPGFVLTETMAERGMTEQFAKQWGGAPPEVPATVVAWIADDPAAGEFNGQTVFAQRHCKKLGLVPGWPPPRD